MKQQPGFAKATVRSPRQDSGLPADLSGVAEALLRLAQGFKSYPCIPLSAANTLFINNRILFFRNHLARLKKRILRVFMPNQKRLQFFGLCRKKDPVFRLLMTDFFGMVLQQFLDPIGIEGGHLQYRLYLLHPKKGVKTEKMPLVDIAHPQVRFLRI
jgi:hypothetical protein